MELPFVIMSRTAYKKCKRDLNGALDKCKKLEQALLEASKTIEDMKSGNLVCGEHCESCRNVFIHRETGVYGNYIKTHCKLKAANTCASYQPVDPA